MTGSWLQAQGSGSCSVAGKVGMPCSVSVCKRIHSILSVHCCSSSCGPLSKSRLPGIQRTREASAAHLLSQRPPNSAALVDAPSAVHRFTGLCILSTSFFQLQLATFTHELVQTPPDQHICGYAFHNLHGLAVFVIKGTL